MNTKKIITTTSIIGGIGIIAYSIYYFVKTQADLLQNFTYRIMGINVTTMNAQLIKGTMTVNFSNNSDVEVAVKEFYLDFFLNGEYVGYMQDFSGFLVKGRQTTPITFEFTLNPQLVLGNISDILLFSVRASDVAFSVRGKASAKSGFIKATIPISFDTTAKCT